MNQSKDESSALLNGCDVKQGKNVIRLAVKVSGIVQGVGFRPFVYNLARRLDLNGFVRNVTGTVEIEIQGEDSRVDRFLNDLKSEPPPLSVVNDVSVKRIDPYCKPEASFVILESQRSAEPWQAVPADAATCEDCVRELFDRKDRRYRYPFINCTNCGPRFTIIDSIPYDRKSTSMDSFAMCRECRQEYNNPADRRFHAQPNACHACGPQVTWLNPDSSYELAGEDALSECLKFLKAGKIVAVKGLGGYHLVCDARNETAVGTLRQRKGRYAKPLAVLMPDMKMVLSYATVSGHEEKLLSGCQRPILLLERREKTDLAGQLAPGTDLLGIMLPYTPLHHMLSRDFAGPLVATSGNASEEPIAIENNEAIERLSHIADAFLMHNRDIRSRYDDSVARLSGAAPVFIRRSRGWAPLPIALSFGAEKPVLALGAHLKNTFCLLKKDQAFISQHIGDLENLETLEHLEDVLETYKRLFEIEPALIACDMHPDYLSTDIAIRLGKEKNLPVKKVQHHHAHIASIMAENDLHERVIGIAFDGMGYGTDGTVWGGEFLLANYSGFSRLAHLKSVPQPGGAAAVKHPWRMAAGYLAESEDPLFLRSYLNELSGQVEPREVDYLSRQLEKKINCVPTSSCGRLFDAVSAVLGICRQAHYEGQAAVELEVAAWQDRNETNSAPTPYELSLDCSSVPYRADPVEILAAVLKDRKEGLSTSRIAHTFHVTLAHLILQTCLKLKEENSINIVCLAGGVFQNRLLYGMAMNMLRESGFAVFSSRCLPVNDGGISLGQAAVALNQSEMMIIEQDGD